EDAARLDQPAFLAAREIDLRDVAVDHRLGAEADARKEHLHLLGRGVLRLVEDDEGVVEGTAAHVGERRELDRAALEQLAGLLEAHQVVERVVQRPQVRVDLLREVAGQEAQALAGFHRGAYQHDALDLVALERVDRACHGEIGLAGARRPDAEGAVVREDVLDVLHLMRRAAVQLGAPREQLRAGCSLTLRLVRQLGQPELHVLQAEVTRGAVVEMLEGVCRLLRLLAVHGELGAAARDGHVERRLDLPQVLVERATQPRQALVVDRVQLDFDRLGPSQTSSPRSEWDSTAVIRTSAYERWSALLPGKFTTRLFAVRPASSAGFLFEAPSTSTRWV